MTSHNNGDKPPWTEATIIDIKTFGSVRLLRLKVPLRSLTFEPGQWVDFNIPGVTPFTGYSMLSPPSLLESSGELDLAVKYSDYPPTLWVHEKCCVGDKVQIRVGGDFYYSAPPPASSPPSSTTFCERGQGDVLLLAAGIGISPIYSILQHYLQRDHHEDRILLLYSGKSATDLVFKDEIMELEKHNSCFTATLFSSQDPVKQSEMNHIREGRITETDVKEAVSSLNKALVQAFICGPPGFLDHMEMFCLASGLHKDQIHYEKWW
ncbi:oxidoreductase NAD-binding domain-containing protein 1-like [Elysia marginata]|uniref:Oxidoreductase NAD-binding domain-containing protein 1 n=1 Tax=Elysia marginata TaxID=1093978 RepID=A0AAV4I2K2_9GAST|nr:oxidoreductase NAD-binding domain-containing protein 1-like [Elysia marginata]